MLHAGVAAFVAAVGGTRAQEPVGVVLDADDIGGVVASAQGPEAGVWVIAETGDLPTPFARIVVTDDEGRYVVPDLPEADYEVFVRGYGLLDSERVAGVRGQRLDLAATVAPDGRSAAAVYPPASWLSLLEIPDGDIPPLQVASTVKSCLQCHPLGNEGTRQIPEHLAALPADEAWEQRLGSELFGGSMMTAMYRGLGAQARMFGRWTDAIAAGAYPEAPPRPSGLERNVVLSVWDWATPRGSRSDSQGTYSWNPTLNAGGRVYGVHQEDTMLSWLDPVTHEVGRVELDAGGLRSIAMDRRGRVWATARLDPGDAPPDFCGPGSDNPYLAHFRPSGSPKQAVVYDPRDGSVEKIPSCLAVDHNHFTDEDDSPIYFGVNDAVGWIDTEVWDETPRRRGVAGLVPRRPRHQRRRGHHRVDGARPAHQPRPRPPHRVRLLLHRCQRQRRQPLVRRHRRGRQQARAVRAGERPARELHGGDLRGARARHPHLQERRGWRSTATASSGSTGAGRTRSPASTAAVATSRAGRPPPVGTAPRAGPCTRWSGPTCRGRRRRSTPR